MSDPLDLDRLADDLNASSSGTGKDAVRLEEWLDLVTAEAASDLYLVAGAPPSIRVNGVVRRLAEAPLDGHDIEETVVPALAGHAQRQYRASGCADGSLRRPRGRRFRVNLHRERGRPAATIRALPANPPLLGGLQLPAGVERLTHLHHGLVLVGGPTGSGKTTTLAALVDVINRRDAKHIVTIEDPIEYEHPHHRSIVEQVEIGIDAPDFPTALRSAVRQSPDVIVVGEMRDTETMQIALAAGETGHLVFSTLHTADVTSTICRVADSFAPERQAAIRQELANALAAVMTQVLIPKAGGGRIPAVELLMVGYGARQHIRKNALQHLHQEITITRPHGSFSLEESLAALVANGSLGAEEARTFANHRDELESLLRAG
jgi:twitching motility protein PilT